MSVATRLTMLVPGLDEHLGVGCGVVRRCVVVTIAVHAAVAGDLNLIDAIDGWIVEAGMGRFD